MKRHPIDMTAVDVADYLSRLLDVVSGSYRLVEVDLLVLRRTVELLGNACKQYDTDQAEIFRLRQELAKHLK